MRMINADDLEQALRDAGLTEVIKDDCSKCTSAWGVPIVDAEPVRHGHWETDGMQMDDGDYLVTRCTVCGTPYEYGHNDNYCGYCGAKMDEVEE